MARTREPVSRQVAAAALFAAAGAALGFLYWLGWGLISLVNAPWYAVGLVFGALAWAGVALPLLVGHSRSGCAASAEPRSCSPSSGW